ncbi:MAG: DUF2179 domain-containing protein [Planctomycetota bacterium]
MFNFQEFFNRYAEWLPLFIFLCRIVDVSLGTIRTIFVIRGARVVAPLLGFVEVTVWIVAVSSVVKRLDHPLNILAYAGGFATGNWVGMWLESKLAIGQQIVRLISRERGHSIAHALRMNGMGVTEVHGRGRDGPVTICFAAVPRRETRKVIRTARCVDSEVFVTIEDTRDSEFTLYRSAPAANTGWWSFLKKK